MGYYPATASERTCLQCDQVYQHLPYWKFGRYCSKFCYGKSQRHQYQLTCKYCGKSCIKENKQRFCSQDCAKNARYGERPNNTCIVCSKVFPYRRGNNANLCCSRECGWKYKRLSSNYGKVCYCEWKHCKNCDKPFQAKTPKAFKCCKTPKRVRPKRKCHDCGIEVGSYKLYCKVCAHIRKEALAQSYRKKFRKTIKAKRRAKQKSVIHTSVSMNAIIMAHGSKCHICGTNVDMTLKRGPMMPSMDHVVPLSLGGWHDLLNLRVAHHICNSRKSNKFSGQLMLTLS